MSIAPIRILGIDPGLRRTGWGLIESDGNRLIHVACGSVVSNDKAGLAERLVEIHDGLTRVIEEFRPVEAAVENTFVQFYPTLFEVAKRFGTVKATYDPNHKVQQ